MFADTEKALEKYYLILEKAKKENPDFIKTIEVIQKILKSDKSSYSKNFKILINFENMMVNLESEDLTLKEKIQIILHLLRLNVYNWEVDKESLDVNVESIINYPFKYTTKAKIKKMIKDDTLADFFVKDRALLSPKEQKVQDELIKAVKEILTETDNPIAVYAEIKKHFFDKYPYLEREDIDIFLKDLKVIGINVEIRNGFARYLEDDLEKLKKAKPTYEESLLAKLYEGIKKLSRLYERSVVNYDIISTQIDNEELLNKAKLGRRLTKQEKKIIDTDTFVETLSSNEFDNLIKIVAGASIYNYLRYPERAYFSQALIVNFTGLNMAMSAASFTKSEITDFVFWCLKRNIEAWNFDERGEFIADYINMKDIQTDIICAKGLFLETMLERLGHDTITPAHQYIAMDCASIENINFDHFKENLMAINRHYFAKEKLTKEDIEIIILALNNLGLAKPYLQTIETTLIKRNLRKEKEPKVEPIVRERQNITLRPLISKKEYNRIWTELNECYNFDNMFPIRYLSEEEIIGCVHKLRYLNFSDEVVARFLETTLKENVERDANALIKYKDMYAKIQYFLEMYPSDERVINIWNELQCAFSKIMLCSPDDYEFLKEYLTMELGDFAKMTEGNFSYEIEEANKR